MLRRLTLPACLAGLCLAPARAQNANQLDSSLAMFTVMAAANATGYDSELRSPSNHPLRNQVRAAIEAKNPKSLAAIRAFLEARRGESPDQDFAYYLSFALCIEDPPSFKLRYQKVQLPPEVKRLEGFEELLKTFYEEADIAGLWKQVQPAIEQELARYQPGVVEAVQAANMYLRNPTSGAQFKRFQIYLDFLGAPNRVQTRTFVDDYFVVVSASPQPRISDIRRAYLHYLIDPWMLRNAETLEKKRPLQDLALASPILDDIYKTDFVLLAGMSLVKAIEARLATPGMRNMLVERAMSEGFILAGYFYDCLLPYEKDERSMRLAIPDLIEAIDLKKEDRRIAEVKFASKRETAVVARPRAPEPAPLTGAMKDIEDAETLYEKRQVAAAKTAYTKVLSGDAQKPIRARAYYGLARLAILEKDPEAAEKFFAQALEFDPEPAVKAWLHVYLARLATAAEDYERAVQQYQAALAVNGASDMARASAEKELQKAVAARKKEN